MGPGAIFDKSALQALSMDEAVWFDAFFLANVVPMFYVETLADLEKTLKRGQSAEALVGMLAEKTPSGALPNVHHRTLIVGELLGSAFEMDGRPIVGGGDTMQSPDASIGVHFDEFPEAAALLRWRRHEFLEVERAAARRWRAELAVQDPGPMVAALRPILPRDMKLSNLEGLKAFIDEFCANDGRVFTMALQVLGLPASVKRAALERWQAAGRPRLDVFAPYCAHVFKVDLVFYLGIARGFISGARASNLIDIAYLYYLPFATVFISGDKLHRSTAPLFLTDRQAYLWKDDFKGALGELDQHYDRLPEAIKRLGVMRFATYPPAGMDNAVTRLWDAQLGPGWREAAKRHEAQLGQPRSVTADQTTVADVTRKLEQARPVPPEQEQAVAPDDPDYLFRRRWVPAQKGKWRLVPDQVLRGHDSSQT